MATSKCSYPKCPGYPIVLRSLCLGCQIHSYHHICQTELEQELGISLELTRKCHYCIWSVIEDHNIAKRRREEAATAAKRRREEAAAAAVPPSTTATDVAPVRNDFIPPSSIGVSQEATDTHSVTKTLTNIAGNTNDGNIPPPVIAAAAVCNTEENTPPPTGKKSQHGFSNNSGCSVRRYHILVRREKGAMKIERRRSMGLEELLRFQIKRKTWHITSLNTIVLFMRMIL